MPERPERFRSWRDSGLPPNSPGTIVTVGTFDGVHLGHQDVLRRIAARAEETGLESVLVTFDPHPLEIVRPAKAPMLLTVGMEKVEVMAESGVRYLAIVPFTPTLQSYTAAQFVDEVLIRRFHMRELVIGYDHHFGRDREGSAEVLRQLGARRGFKVDVVGPVTAANDTPISSSAIRRAVAAGELDAAAAGLGRPYSLSGVVAHGDKRGRLLGFPTINVPSPSPRKLLPPHGVYAVFAQTPAGRFGGMLHLGPRPAFGDERVSIEANLFDMRADLYGAFVRIEFVARLRDVVSVDPDALVALLHRDEQDARAALRRALTPERDSSKVKVPPRNTVPYL